MNDACMMQLLTSDSFFPSFDSLSLVERGRRTMQSQEAFFPALKITDNDQHLLLRACSNGEADSEIQMEKICDDRSRIERAFPAVPSTTRTYAFSLVFFFYALYIFFFGCVGFGMQHYHGERSFNEARKIVDLLENSSCSSCVYYEKSWPNCENFCRPGGERKTASVLEFVWKPKELKQHCHNKTETIKCIFWDEMQEWTDWSPCLRIYGRQLMFRRKALPKNGVVINFKSMPKHMKHNTLWETKNCTVLRIRNRP
ncbi:hypothetical protein QR680_018562 [Steinernema hermaphroditum]|uniref:Uncharacterized protein n=1 Tax=Steinernema hermaphroditum TaxID=289476 RepID=A0AA39HKL2_9BILA|nr:hypothetical protein QR680_018562 [Steinernema hermaphroditum]